LNVSDSGDRKSTSVEFAKRPILEYNDDICADIDNDDDNQEYDPDNIDHPCSIDYFQNASEAGLNKAFEETGGRLVCHEPEPGLLHFINENKRVVHFFNNAYDCEDITIHRGDRKRTKIKKPSIEMNISSQPEPAIEFLRNKYVNTSGLRNRFFFLVCQSLVGFRRTNAPPIPEQFREWWKKKVRNLMDISAPTQGASRHRVRFDPVAERLHKDFAAYIEVETQLGRSLSFSNGYSSKLADKTSRLALHLHCALEADPLNTLIGLETVRSAIALAQVFTTPARQLFFRADFGKSIDIGESILHWALRAGVHNFSAADARDFHPQHGTKEIHSAINLLLRSGQIYEDLAAFGQSERSTRRGRDLAPRYRLAMPGGCYQP
jgi:hypothetical protein